MECGPSRSRRSGRYLQVPLWGRLVSRAAFLQCSELPVPGASLSLSLFTSVQPESPPLAARGTPHSSFPPHPGSSLLEPEPLPLPPSTCQQPSPRRALGPPEQQPCPLVLRLQGSGEISTAWFPARTDRRPTLQRMLANRGRPRSAHHGCKPHARLHKRGTARAKTLSVTITN